MTTNELFILLLHPAHIYVNNLCIEVHFNTAFIGDHSYIINFLLVEEGSYMYILKLIGSCIFDTTKKGIDCHSTIPPLTVSSASRSRVILKNGIFNYISLSGSRGSFPPTPLMFWFCSSLGLKRRQVSCTAKVFNEDALAVTAKRSSCLMGKLDWSSGEGSAVLSSSTENSSKTTGCRRVILWIFITLVIELFLVA